MKDSVHELINEKMQEAGIKVTDRSVCIIPDCYGTRYGQSFIPGAQVTVGEFTVIGLAYLSEDLAKQVVTHAPPENLELWPRHCLKGETE